MHSHAYIKQVLNKSPLVNMWRGILLFQDRYQRRIIVDTILLVP
jgi:hypothetical protein